MKKFYVIYYAPDEVAEKWASGSEEDMALWMTWAEKIGASLVNMGSPLGNGQNITSSGVTESTKNVLGYSILQADDMDEAKGLLKGHPHLEFGKGCEIEVYETFSKPQ